MYEPKSKIDCYYEFLTLFCWNGYIPHELLEQYLTGSDDGYTNLADYLGEYKHDQIKWSTSIGLIEAADLVYKVALENGNI